MTAFNISVDKLFNGERVFDRQTVWIEDGKIKRIENATSNSRLKSGMLVPGYIDVQVNGGGGYLFNQNPTVHAIDKIGTAHQRFGTTGWLPTLVTDSVDKMERAADAVADAIARKIPGVLGIHFEGPFLSKEKKGVHSESLIREISGKEISIITRNDLGKVIVTLAPENVFESQIRELVSSGIIVCLGHSNATFGQVNRALKAGATGFTHLFNAMSALGSREPGMVGAALLDQNSYAGLILDGIHVHPDSALLAYKAKSKIMLVTDAMPPVGSDNDSFDFFGDKIERSGLRLTDSAGRLAGSVLDMNSAVINAIQMLGINQSRANNLASKNPACFLGLENQYGKLKTGYYASMILIDNDHHILACWIDGQEIFNKS